MWRNHFISNLKSKDLFLFAEDLNLQCRMQLTSPSLPPGYECFVVCLFVCFEVPGWYLMAIKLAILHSSIVYLVLWQCLCFHSRAEIIIIQFGMYFKKKPSHLIGVPLKAMPNVQFLKVISRKRWGRFLQRLCRCPGIPNTWETQLWAKC